MEEEAVRVRALHRQNARANASTKPVDRCRRSMDFVRPPRLCFLSEAPAVVDVPSLRSIIRSTWGGAMDELCLPKSLSRNDGEVLLGIFQPNMPSSQFVSS